MARILISVCLSLFYLGVMRLITQNWAVAVLTAIFVLVFSFLGLSLSTSARFSDEV